MVGLFVLDSDGLPSWGFRPRQDQENSTQKGQLSGTTSYWGFYVVVGVVLQALSEPVLTRVDAALSPFHYWDDSLLLREFKTDNKRDRNP